MRVVVVGSAGLVGHHVVAAAIAGAHQVTALARALPDGTPLDLGADLSGLRKVCAQADAVIWAAALPSVEGCEADPTTTRIINVDVVAAVLKTLAPSTAFVAFSSEYVFDGCKGSDYVEGDTRRAINVYGQQKIDLEDVVLTHPKACVLRISGVYGPEAHSRKNFVLQLIDASRAGRRLAVACDQWITPTFAPDLGAVVVDVAGSVARGSFAGLLHAAGPVVLRRDAFAEQVAAVLGLRDDVVDAKGTLMLGLKAPRPAHVGLCTSLLRQVTTSVIRSPREALSLFKES